MLSLMMVTDDEELILVENQINHVELVQNLGIGGAVQTGYLYALQHDYDIAIQYDGDGQHDIQSIPKLIAPILQGQADFTVGSRYVNDSDSTFKSTQLRQMGIQFLSTLIKIVSGIKIKDVTSGFRAANKQVIVQFAARYPSKYPEPESYMHLFSKGFSVKEVGVKMFERETGESSIGLLHSVNYMSTVSLAIVFEWLISRGNRINDVVRKEKNKQN
jgi:glycosyltransferase involved in cell wall biosynthesis